MLNKKKMISIASAGIALMAITGSVYAATSTDNTSTTSTTSTQKQKPNKFQHKGPFNNQELASLLNVDANTLQQNVKDGKSIAEIATTQGVDEQKVIDLLVNQETQRLDQAISSGKLTQDKVDEMKKNMQDKVKNMVENKGGFRGGHGGGFKGHDGMGGPMGEAASVLGVDQQQLFTQLKSGKTLAQIALDKGISEQDLIDKLLQKDKERITKMVEQTWPQHKKDATSSSDTNSTAQPTTSADAPATE